MSIITMTYPARCKHCLNFGRQRKTKKDGTPSKQFEGRCKAKECYTTAATVACDKFKL